MRSAGEFCRRGAIAFTLVLTIHVGGCAQTPSQRGAGAIYGECVADGVLILPIAMVFCAPTAVVVHGVESGVRKRQEESRPRKTYLNRFELLGILPETEISAAGELYLDTFSPKLNDRGLVDAKLVIGLNDQSSLKEYSIVFDVEADCTAGTLHARQAKSYDDIGGLGDLVAYKGTPTKPIEGMHPVLGISLERLCQTAEKIALAEKSAPVTSSTVVRVAQAGALNIDRGSIRRDTVGLTTATVLVDLAAPGKYRENSYAIDVGVVCANGWLEAYRIRAHAGKGGQGEVLYTRTAPLVERANPEPPLDSVASGICHGGGLADQRPSPQ